MGSVIFRLSETAVGEGSRVRVAGCVIFGWCGLLWQVIEEARMKTSDYLSARNARLAELQQKIRTADAQGRQREVRRLRRKYEAIRTGRAIPLRA